MNRAPTKTDSKPRWSQWMKLRPLEMNCGKDTTDEEGRGAGRSGPTRPKQMSAMICLF